MKSEYDILNKTAFKLLKRLEWSGYQQGQGFGYMGSGNDGVHYPACPICNGIKPGVGAERDFSVEAIGHMVRCVLKNILLKEKM
jgi:hypothetical protein